MKKQLIKTIKFYTDGTYEEFLENNSTDINDDIVDILNKIFSDLSASRKIKFNVAIYVVSKYYLQKDITDNISLAFDYVAQNQKVTRQTVSDKSFRQLDLCSAEYKELLVKALDGNTYPLRSKLIENCGIRTLEYDKQLIDKFIPLH